MASATFGTFESDQSNRFALRLAQAAAELESQYSPIVLHGGIGAGKSHLLNAIASDLKVRHPDVPFLYLSDHTPVEYLLTSPKGGDVPDLGYMYRPYIDQRVLLVDNLERFASEAVLASRFTQLFDAFFETGRVVVVACDDEPHRLQGFDKRFLARLNSGVAAELVLPNADTRLRILEHEAERLGFPIESSALATLVELPSRSVGELVHAFGQVRLFCVATGQDPAAPVVAQLVERIADAFEQDQPVAAERWCAQWYVEQVESIRESHSTELDKAQARLREIEQQLAAEAGDSDSAKTELLKSHDNVQALEAELNAVRSERDALSARVESEVRQLSSRLEERTAHMEEAKAEALQERDALQARISELAAQHAEAKQDAAKSMEATVAQHEKEVAELEARLEDIYTSLNDAQQDFAIRNQNKDKLLEKLSEDFQQAKEQSTAWKSQVEALEAERSAASELLESTGDEVAALKDAIANLEAQVQETEHAGAKARTALEDEHQRALAAERDTASIELNEVRSQLEAKESALRSITEDLQDRLGALERETRIAEEAKADLAAATEQISSLNEEITALHDSVSTEAQTASETAEQLEAVRRELAGVRKQLEERDAQLEESQSSAKTQEDRLTEAQRTMQERGEQLAVLRKELSELHESANAHEASARETKEALASRDEELQKLREAVRILAEERDKARKAGEAHEAQLQEARETHATVLANRDATITEVSATLEALQSEHAEARQAWAGREAHLADEADALRDTIAERDASIDRLRAQEQEQSEALQELTAKVETAEASVTEMMKQVADRDALSEALKSERERIRMLDSQITELEEQLRTVKSDLDTQQANEREKVQGLSEQLRAAMEQLDAQKSQVEAHEEESASLRTKAAEADDARMAAENALREQELDLTSLRDDHARLQTDLDGRNDQVKSYKQIVETLERQVEEKEQLLSEVRVGDSEELQKLKAELQDQGQALAEARARNAELSTHQGEAVTSLQEELTSTQQQATEARRQLQEAVDARETLEAQLQRLQEQVAGTEEAHVLALQSLNSELDLLRNQTVAPDPDAEAQIEKWKGEAEQRQTELESIRARAESLAAEAEDARAARETAERERAAASERAQAAEREKSGFTETIANLQAQIEEAETGRSALAQEIQEHRSQATSSRAELDAAKAMVESLRSSLTERQDEFSRLQDQVVSLESAASAAANERGASVEELEQLTTELATARSEADAARSTMESTEHRAREADAALEALRATHESLKEELTQAAVREQEALQRLADGAAAGESVSAAKAAQLQQQLAAVRSELSTKDTAIEQLGAELADVRGSVLEAEASARAESLQQVRELEERLAQAEAGDAGAELRDRIMELESEVSARGRALETLQAKFADELAGAGAKQREKEATLTSTVHELQAQLNALQVSSDDRQEEIDRLKAQIGSLHAELAEAHAQVASGPAVTETSTPVAEPPPAAPATITQPPVPTAAPALHKVAVPQTAPLDSSLTFEAFEATGASAFSLRSTQQVTQTPGELYNPLVIYGPQQSGKTHVLHAIGNAIGDSGAQLSVVYTTLDALMDLIASLPADIDLDNIELDADVILIDEFDIVGLDKGPQNQLALLLSNFVAEDKQLALASAMPPVKMTMISRELVRFLEDGLLVKFEPNPAVVAQLVDALAQELNEEPAEEPVSEPTPPPPPPAEPTPMPTPTRPKLNLYPVDPDLRADSYRGKKVLDAFVEAYQQPNANRKMRFPFIATSDDRSKRHHFFHALTNSLTGVFPNATIRLLSLVTLIDEWTRNADFDFDTVHSELLQADIVLINDCDALDEATPEILRGVRQLVQDLVGNNALVTFGMAKAAKKDPLFGELVAVATKKRL